MFWPPLPPRHAPSNVTTPSERPIADTPLRLLTIASRPSDFVEMADLARALAWRGHTVMLLYFYSSTDPTSPPTVDQVKALGKEDRLQTAGVDLAQKIPTDLRTYSEIDTAHARAAAAASAAAKAAFEASKPIRGRISASLKPFMPRLPKLPPLFPVVHGLAEWLRRHNLHRLYPKNTWLSRAVYSAAFQLDNFTWRELAHTFRQMILMRGRLQGGGSRQALDAAYLAAFMVAIYRQWLRFFVKLIQRRALDAVLIPEDIVGSTWPVAVAAAHHCHIPALVLPYTLANREEAVQSLKNEEAFQTRTNQIAADSFPAWRYRNGEIDIVRLPSAHIFAHQELGIAPPDPWMMNSGYADRILVDSAASLEYFAAGDIPRERMVIVGSVSQDRMFSLQRHKQQHLEQLRSELGLSGDKPLLLISGCPNQLAAVVPFCEFQTMEQLAGFIGRTVEVLANDYHLVVRPHPNYVEFGAMLERYGVRSTMTATASLVPLADLFIAFASATIRWAIACGVASINYDVFHYGYGDFAAAKGVVSVQASTDFARLVAEMSPDSSRRQQLAEIAARDCAEWSMMDGGAILRIEEEIHRARQQRG